MEIHSSELKGFGIIVMIGFISLPKYFKLSQVFSLKF